MVLRCGDMTLAFEISITNTAGYEVGNLKKCLKGGFYRVFFVCSDEKRRKKVQTLLASEQNASTVLLVAPEEVVTALDSLAVNPPNESVVRGYRVKVKRQAISSTELAGKRAVIAEVVARSMMR